MAIVAIQSFYFGKRHYFVVSLPFQLFYSFPLPTLADLFLPLQFALFFSILPLFTISPAFVLPRRPFSFQFGCLRTVSSRVAILPIYNSNYSNCHCYASIPACQLDECTRKLPYVASGAVSCRNLLASFMIENTALASFGAFLSFFFLAYLLIVIIASWHYFLFRSKW